MEVNSQGRQGSQQYPLSYYIGERSGNRVSTLSTLSISKEIIVRVMQDYIIPNPKDTTNIHQFLHLKAGFMYLLPKSWVDMLELMKGGSREDETNN